MILGCYENMFTSLVSNGRCWFEGRPAHLAFYSVSYTTVALPCTDPDWDSAVTERTSFYLVDSLSVNACSVRVPSLLLW